MKLSEISHGFWEKVNKTRGGCWNWAGYRTQRGKGYGMLQARKISQQPMYAHRVAWELINGPISSGLHVLHKCDNPACCNPEHLFLGTQRDNNLDRDTKGRVAKGDNNGARTHPEKIAKGVENGQSKLTNNVVLSLRAEYASGGITQRKLAEKYCISQQHVSVIIHRKQWSHI